MESTISATYLAKNLSDVLTRVKDRGERFAIEKELVHLGLVSRPRRTGSSG